MNEITEKIIGSAIRVHRVLGPGLLESAYEICLAYELAKLGLGIEKQKALPVIYEKVKLDCGYRIDLLVEKCVVVEIKSVELILPIHVAQLLSYLRLSGIHIGLLINFNVYRLKDGIRRIVN
jgi:GxxExxY protein